MSPAQFVHWASRFPDALLLVGMDGQVVAANAPGTTLLGCTLGAMDCCSLYDFAVSPPDAVRSALALWSGSGQMMYGPARFCAKSGDEFRCEGALLASETGGTTRLLLVRLRRHQATVGKFLSLNQTIERLSHEIHARKRSEEEIRQQREWLHVTLSSIGDAVVATDVEGRVEFMNHEAERLTGWRVADAQFQPLTRIVNLFNETTLAKVETPVAQVIASGKMVGLANHTVLRSRDGACWPIEDSAAPIRSSDGAIVGVVMVFRDVGQKRKAQAELAESERRFRLWTEMNVIAAGVSDLVGTYVDGNDALLQLFGYTRDDMNAGRIKWRELTPPEYAAKDEAALAEAKARGACQPYEKEYIHRAGRRVPVIIGYALFNSPQRYRHQQSDDLAMCFVVDISERKRAEELLERRVEERTARLQEALAELEAFSYTISHDLRAPLRSMRSYSQILLEEHSAALEDEAKGFLERIVRSGDHLHRLIQDVLKYAQVSKSSYELQPIDLSPMLNEMVEQYPNLSSREATIEIAPGIPMVKGHTALLTQVFANLIGNAVKFVRPEIKPHIKIYGEMQLDRVRVWVVDNGIGIAPEDRDRIFGLFERLHHASAYSGTGIGLSIVRKAIEKMNGSVGLASEPGVGSRFWVELPPA